MKILIYISGISAVILLIIRVLGLYIPALNINILLFTGIGLLVFIFIPMIVYYNRKQDQKIAEIIKSHKEKTSSKPGSKKDAKTKAKGWNMNNSPFRERRSGLNWGGGNIHAANAKRGSRRKFL
ncbi:MAG: hypothetical protein ACOCWA_02570 [Bacteroidota bacterium]